MTIEFDLYDLERLKNHWLPILEKEVGEVNSLRITTVRNIDNDAPHIYFYSSKILSDGKEYEWGQSFPIDEIAGRADVCLYTAARHFYHAITAAQSKIDDPLIFTRD